MAQLYDTDSSIAPHYRYTSLAAALLYTTLADLELFFGAHLEGVDNEPIGQGVLKPETIAMMRIPTGKVKGIRICG